MQINRTFGASILTALAYALAVAFGDVGNVGENLASPGVMLNILTPVIIYIFSKFAFGDAALNSWLVVIINFFISLRFILN